MDTATVSRGPALRLLPIVIIAAVSMLGFRLQVVVQSIADQQKTTVEIAPATAMAQAQPSQPISGSTTGSMSGGEAETSGNAATGDESAMDENGLPGADAMSMSGGEPMVINPSDLTSSEIETLQRLAERREIIEQRERELQQKENLVMAAERRLDQKIGQMEEIESELRALVEQYDAKKNSEIEQLVRIYTAMKPKDAARIFDNLDMSILVTVVTNMKENKVAPILSQMDAEKARQLTEEMSSRRQFQGMNPPPAG